EPLPEANVELCRKDIVDSALSRRPEMAMVSNMVQIYHLEVEAQNSFCKVGLVTTFTAAGDLHAQVPPKTINTLEEYRPGTLPWEMPPYLGGKRAARVKAAEGYAAKADALAEKARNLIALEAEYDFLKWQEAGQKVALLRTSKEAA